MDVRLQRCRGDTERKILTNAGHKTRIERFSLPWRLWSKRVYDAVGLDELWGGWRIICRQVTGGVERTWRVIRRPSRISGRGLFFITLSAWRSRSRMHRRAAREGRASDGSQSEEIDASVKLPEMSSADKHVEPAFTGPFIVFSAHARLFRRDQAHTLELR